LAYIKKHVPERGVALLAGNSVHADQAFLKKEPYKRVLEHLHYRILDVSSVKEAARRWWYVALWGVQQAITNHPSRQSSSCLSSASEERST
jgi:oligoribonuclease (3'-5' exoribonuclease)